MFEDETNAGALGGTVHNNDGFCKLEDSGGRTRSGLAIFAVPVRVRPHDCTTKIFQIVVPQWFHVLYH